MAIHSPPMNLESLPNPLHTHYFTCINQTIKVIIRIHPNPPIVLIKGPRKDLFLY